MVISEDTTRDELAETLAHLVANARGAQDRRIYDVWHRRINEHLDAYEALDALNLFGPSPV
jgi:hypothetical protein